ncbi:MAG: MerC domain-containing protein [Phycisphaerales bacterium JB063]
MTACQTPATAAPAERPTRDNADTTWLDKIGITASFACVIHCLVAPFLLLLLPTVGSVWADPWVHWVLAVFVLPLALLVIYRGYRRHGKRWVFAAALLGVALVTAGLVAPYINDRPIIQTPAPAMLAGFGGASSPAPADQPAATCADGCCPTLAVSESGATTLGIPAGGLLTILGSLLLVAGHSGNLLACHCFRAHGKGEPAGCGCPG